MIRKQYKPIPSIFIVILLLIILNESIKGNQSNNLSRQIEALRKLEVRETPEAILFGGGGVCDSYSKLFYIMANEASLEVKYITGHVNGQAHSWNMVKVDNDWYHIDVTHDDPVVGRVFK